MLVTRRLQDLQQETRQSGRTLVVQIANRKHTVSIATNKGHSDE